MNMMMSLLYHRTLIIDIPINQQFSFAQVQMNFSTCMCAILFFSIKMKNFSSKEHRNCLVDILFMENDRTRVTCPCCMHYIYENMQCSNSIVPHNMCYQCYNSLPVANEIKKCPMCSDTCLRPVDTGVICDTTECPNKSRGCNLSIYTFDNEHLHTCTYNPLRCKFCDVIVDDSSINSITHHFVHNCINSFNLLAICGEERKERGKLYNINIFDVAPTIINMDSLYIMMIVPKSASIDILFMSPLRKFAKAKYQVSFMHDVNKVPDVSQATPPVFISTIHYNRMQHTTVPRMRAKPLIFSVSNKFITNNSIKSTVTTTDTDILYDGEGCYEDGEPDSPGNWSYKAYREMHDTFVNVFFRK